MLARLEGEAVDRLVRTAKAALDSNLLERRAWLAERTAELVAAAAERAIERMGGFSYDSGWRSRRTSVRSWPRSRGSPATQIA
jgi:hypothetical protein